MPLSIITFNMRKLRVIILSIAKTKELSINNTQHLVSLCRLPCFFIVMLSVLILGVIMMRVVMLNAVTLSLLAIVYTGNINLWGKAQYSRPR